jgi:hypothetical protein
MALESQENLSEMYDNSAWNFWRCFRPCKSSVNDTLKPAKRFFAGFLYLLTKCAIKALGLTNLSVFNHLLDEWALTNSKSRGQTPQIQAIDFDNYYQV